MAQKNPVFYVALSTSLYQLWNQLKPHLKLPTVEECKVYTIAALTKVSKLPTDTVSFHQWMEENNATIIIILCIIAMISMIISSTPKKPVLEKDTWIELPLTEVEELSHDVKRFRFSFKNKSDVLGLPIGQHITLKFVDTDGKEVLRSYTPVSSDENKGYVGKCWHTLGR